MKINLYTGVLIIGEYQGICTITAYDEKQAKEIAEDYWKGYKSKDGIIKINLNTGISCECNVNSSLKVINGNSLEEILMLRKEEECKEKYILGDYVFDTIRQTLTYKDGNVETLTTKENNLLVLFCCSEKNHPLDRNFILEKVWGESNYFNSRSMDVYVYKLRKHLDKDPRIELINIHGKGLKFVVPE